MNALYTPEAQVLRLAFVALVGIYFFHREDEQELLPEQCRLKQFVIYASSDHSKLRVGDFR